MALDEFFKYAAAVGFGTIFGAVINQFVAIWLAERGRHFAEKKDAYMRFLDAYQELEAERLGTGSSPEAAAQYRKLLNAIDRLVLVGTPEAVYAAIELREAILRLEAAVIHAERRLCMESMGVAYNRARDEFRRDLGVDKRLVSQTARDRRGGILRLLRQPSNKGNQV
jgi:hypothetical protein